MLTLAPVQPRLLQLYFPTHQRKQYKTSHTRLRGLKPHTSATLPAGTRLDWYSSRSLDAVDPTHALPKSLTHAHTQKTRRDRESHFRVHLSLDAFQLASQSPPSFLTNKREYTTHTHTPARVSADGSTGAYRFSSADVRRRALPRSSRRGYSGAGGALRGAAAPLHLECHEPGFSQPQSVRRAGEGFQGGPMVVGRGGSAKWREMQTEGVGLRLRGVGDRVLVAERGECVFAFRQLVFAFRHHLRRVWTISTF